MFEQAIDLFLILDALLHLPIVGQILGDFAEGGAVAALDQVPHDDAACHHGQIGRQAAVATEVSQDGEIVLDDLKKNVRGQIVPVRFGNANGTAACGVIDDMNDQSHESVDKVLPRARLTLKASIEKFAVYVREGHGRSTFTWFSHAIVSAASLFCGSLANAPADPANPATTVNSRQEECSEQD